MTKVAIIDGGMAYTMLFGKLLDMEVVNALDDAELVCFTGGEDVSPHLYGDYHHDKTWNNPQRDEREAAIYSFCRDRDIPMVGICRGAQFLNVMSGGRMYQHVTGHGQPHYLIDQFTGDSVFVSSTHHQMMKPSDNGIIVALGDGVRGKREWYDGTEYRHDVSDKGIEVVYYPHTKCLCFQPHPEFAVYGADAKAYRPMALYFQKLVGELLRGSIAV